MKDIWEIAKDLFKDPILYLPAFVVIVAAFILIRYKRHWISEHLKVFIIISLGIFFYFPVATWYATHPFITIIAQERPIEPDCYALAVLSFDNVTRDADNNRDCHLFRYCLTRAIRLISTPYNLDIIDHREVIGMEKLAENTGLTIDEALECGKNLEVNYIVLGEISPINDILINFKLIEVESKTKILECEISQRLANVQSLADKASELLLSTLRDISKAEKKKTRDRLHTAKPNISASRLFGQGLHAFYEKDFPRATKLLEKAIDEDKNFADPHLLLSYIYFDQKDYKRTINELEMTISKQPDWAEAHYFLGVVYKRTGNFNDAARKYRDAIQFETRLVDKMVYKTALAGAYFKLGKTEKAQAIVDEIEETKTNHKKVLYNLSARYCELGNLDKALFLLEQARRAGLSSYDCKTALDDPDFENFRSDPDKYRHFLELMDKCK
jgi:tetratricopeptide (TPR) repeat protein